MGGPVRRYAALIVVALAGASCGGAVSVKTPTPQPSDSPIGPSTGSLAGGDTGTAPPASDAGTTLPTFFGSAFNAGRAFCLFTHQNAAIAGGVLTVKYPAGSSAPSAGAPYGGAQICEPFTSGPRTSATLTYQVRFPVGFQWVKGGKLPGLYGGVEPFSGEKHNDNGWSLRLMWRTSGAGEIYAYIAGKTGYGLSIDRGGVTWLADGQWHTVSLHVALNTPGNADGSASLSVDGVTGINSTGMTITSTNTQIGGIFFSTFYGGHDASWAPSAPMSVDFSNFAAS